MIMIMSVDMNIRWYQSCTVKRRNGFEGKYGVLVALHVLLCISNAFIICIAQEQLYRKQLESTIVLLKELPISMYTI